MAYLIICTLLGVGLGEMMFFDNGWAIGGALGFLITKVILMTSTIERLERDVTVLQAVSREARKAPEIPVAAARSASVRPARATTVAERSQAEESGLQQTESQQPEPQQTEPQQTAVELTEVPKREKQNIPLAERLKAHGIELPPEATDSTVANEQHIPNRKPDSANGTISPVAARAQEDESAVARQPWPTEPSAPNPFEKGIAFLNRFFTEGNPIVRIGMVVMFFGLSFLVKYASNQGLFPIELRMSAVAAVALALIGLGWKTRDKKDGYGLVLQGGGIAALYLTVFAAAKMYSLMPASAAFGLMFIIVILGAALAILQNAQVLALMATAGGFLAPILTSDGSGNHVGLFSFYLVLNIGILAIAWFKTWRLLNWVGFVFTFVITSAWGVLKYEPHLYASTQPFLLAFFALYLIVSILFSLKQPPNLKGLVDGSLVFGLPIVGFGLQTALLKHTEYGLAISALILAAIYIFLARFLWSKYQATHRVLIESFIALGVTFATLAIPLALDAQWTSATWALEAAGLIWVGLRQQRFLPRFAGYLLHIAAAGSLVIHGINAGATPLIDGDFISLVILAASALCISYLLMRFAEHTSRIEKSFPALTVIIGWLWWLLAGYSELETHVPGEQQFPSLVLFFALSVAGLMALSAKLQWPQLARVGFWLLPLTSVLALRNVGEGLFIGYDVYPSQGWGLLALLTFVGVQYRFLWRQRDISSCGLLSVFHVLTAWFLFGLVYWEAAHWQSELQWSGTSAAMLWFACLVIPLVALLNLTNKSIWPFAQYQTDYKNLIPAPLLFGLLAWFIYACRYSGMTDQFYLPILNPLDLAQAAVITIFLYAIKRNFVGFDSVSAQVRYGFIGMLGFAWINTLLLRAVHQYTGIEYVPRVMWDSITVQMSLSILWAICALVVMNLSRRWQERNLWMLGAGLLGLVLLKLFTKDLTGTGTLARIVSFMVVGALMLLIGYLSPIPAKSKPVEQNTSDE